MHFQCSQCRHHFCSGCYGPFHAKDVSWGWGLMVGAGHGGTGWGSGVNSWGRWGHRGLWGWGTESWLSQGLCGCSHKEWWGP